MIMGRKAVQASVERSGYTTPAVPQETPDRSIQTAAKRYSVVGPHEVFGAKPGDVVELELTEGQAPALIDGGHLEEAPEDPADKKDED